jgi:hypothetical protein
LNPSKGAAVSDITLELVKAKQSELATMIQALEDSAKLVISLPAAEIQLRPGEHYAGAVLDEHGRVKHHLVMLAAQPAQDLTWAEAKSWAEGDAGGSLPTRQEQALLYANCKPHLPKRWCWSSEAEGSAHAWNCYFGDGHQTYITQSAKGCAVAVRRFNP